MKKIALFAVVLTVLSVGYSNAAGKKEAGGANLEPLRLGVMTDTVTEYAAVIGVAEGIFEKHGLKVEIASFAAGINTIDAVTTGQMDIGFGADFAVINRFGGAANSPLRIFTGLNESKPDAWKLYALGSDIQSISDLRGKAAITYLGTVIEYWYAKALAANNIASAEINFLPVDSPLEGVALLQKGSAQAIWASGRAEQSVKQIAGTHVIGDLTLVGAPTVSVAIATEQFLTEHKSIAIKYLRATKEIYDFIASKPEEAAVIIQKANGTPLEQSRTNFQTGINYIKFDSTIFNILNDLRGWAETSGIINYPYDLQKYINVDALKEAFPGEGNF
jgi:NitT/TauT family transport system substrate-binding protein